MAEVDADGRKFQTPDLQQKFESAVKRYGPELGPALYDHAYRPMLERVHSDEMKLNRPSFHAVAYRELRVAMAQEDEARVVRVFSALEESAIAIATRNIRMNPPLPTLFRPIR